MKRPWRGVAAVVYGRCDEMEEARPKNYDGPEITDPELLKCLGMGSQITRHARGIHEGKVIDCFRPFAGFS